MQIKLRNVIVAALAAVCVIYPIYVLIVEEGFFHNRSFNPLLEVVIWFLVALVGIKWHNANWIIAVTIIFSYVHAMLFPMTLAVIYSILTILVGQFLMKKFWCYEEQTKFIAAYFIGMMALTILYAMLSLLKLGSIQNIKIIDCVLLIGLCVWYCKTNKKSIRSLYTGWCKKLEVSANVYVKFLLIMCFLMIAIGRANVSCDYDSMWYGIRSEYVLDNTTGIYENLGLVGCVYTYPKGFETYMLPLNGFNSYGFLYAGNIVLGIWILYVSYKICRLFINRDKAMWGAVLVSAVPGIMNMTITAKPDIITLLVQLIMIYFSVLFIREREHLHLCIVIATYIYAQTLKTTAVIFSTTIFIALIFVCIAYKIKPCFKITSVTLIGISLIDLGLIWYRTYIITGIPATSVWGTFFRLIGMTDKYPYNSGQISQFRSGSLFDEATIIATVVRLKEFFFAPNSTDTDHIIIAWGTTLCTFVMIVILLGILFDLCHTISTVKKNGEVCFVGLLALGEFAGCVLCLWVLSKPDGNYFMLYYATTIIVGVIYVQKLLVENKVFSERLLVGIMVLFLPLNMVFTVAVNWAWTAQFNQIDWINRGYYDHQLKFKEAMYKAGCREIYDIMTADSSNRVYALAEHPFVEQFPCVIESELDVSFWGNAELTSTVENFLQFAKYQNYDYIYIEPGYISEETIAYEYVCRLFDEGMVSKIWVENGYVLIEMEGLQDAGLNLEMKEQFTALY